MNLARSCRENRYAVYLLTALLVAAGIWAMFVLPSNIYPELNFPRVEILVHAGDLSPDAMLLTVTRPLEEASSSVLGVRRVRSRTIRGAAEISILFKPDMDMQYAVQLVQARVSETRSSLPPDADILVSRVTPATRSERAMRARLSESASTPLATARDARLARSARRWAARLPWKRSVITLRSRASSSADETAPCSASIALEKRPVMARSRSRVTAARA